MRRKIRISKRLEQLKKETLEFPGFEEDGKDYVFLPYGEDENFLNMMLKNTKLVEDILGIQQDPEIVEDEFNGKWICTNTIDPNIKFFNNKYYINECFDVILKIGFKLGKDNGYKPEDFCNEPIKYQEFLDFIFNKNYDKLKELSINKLNNN